jgi:hypothetical protein
VPDVISGLGKPANLIVALLAACSVGAAVNLRAAAGQVVVRPAIEQGYIEVQYPVHAGDATAGSGRSVTVRLPLCNQVDPVFRVRVRPQAGYLVYEYELANGPRAKEPIQSFDLIFPSNVSIVGVGSPRRWQHGVILSRVSTIRHALVNRSEGNCLSWYKSGGDTQPLPGGPGMSGFAFSSEYLPGITYSYSHAAYSREHDRVLANLPSEASKAVVRFLDAEFSARPVLLIGPKFHPATPKSEIVSDFLMRLRRREDRLVTLLGEGFHRAALRHLSKYSESLPAAASLTQTRAALRVLCQRNYGSELERELCRALELSLGAVDAQTR